MADEERCFIQGYASVFDFTDTHGDITRKGCFKKDLKAFPYRSMLFNHDKMRILGTWLSMKEDKIGLFVEGIVTDPQAIQWVVTKALLGLSIGYEADHIQQNNDHRNLKAVGLMEVSLTPVPVNREALITYCGLWK